MAILELLTLGRAGLLGLQLYKGGTASLKCLGKTALSAAGADELLIDLLEIPADLGIGLGEDALKQRLADLPPAQLELGNQHLTAFTGAVLQRLTKAAAAELHGTPDSVTLTGAL